MPQPEHLRLSAIAPQPWPNGLGTTRAIASGPDWQIGVAELGGQAAFSHFPGQDRLFTLLGGAGATLEVDGHPLACRPFVPAAFPGDRPTLYRPAAGPARAFNLVFGRGRAAGVAARAVAAGHRIPAGPALAVFCAAGTLACGALRLEEGDTLLHPGDAVLEASAPALVLLVSLG